ncbi:unnamed protein product [Spirodela intermedia]|uniref:BZIP domain-containing protein n=1 Tax=Spirodela intermedia TaxID=51605 RepID=A0A7I8IIM2_SPIIN|nr:unnamed protein product [Spirodela intermedia]CAA6657005.1 unnamed protein product [Spirodela intermedia]
MEEHASPPGKSGDQSRPKRRAMAGMTLEDFLSMEGIAGEKPEKNRSQRRLERAQEDVAAAVAVAYSQSCTSPEPLAMDPGEMVERTVERRQKRMMKNRESAARSRARKQAYTNELENKISRLEEENERLRKQKEMETILYNMPPPELRIQLRRTSSSPL